MPENIRVVVVDDHPIFRQGVVHALGSAGQITVVGEAGSGEAALAMVQELMPDVFHWLGIKKIHRLVSMSTLKFDAITGSGIEIGDRINIPDALIPADARVEMDAKMAAGYFTPGVVPTSDELKQAKGRELAK